MGLSILQISNPNLRKWTSIFAILSSTLFILTLIGAHSQDQENTENINSLVDIHHAFADDVLDYFICMDDDTKKDCTYEVRLVVEHLKKLYPSN